MFFCVCVCVRVSVCVCLCVSVSVCASTPHHQRICVYDASLLEGLSVRLSIRFSICLPIHPFMRSLKSSKMLVLDLWYEWNGKGNIRGPFFTRTQTHRHAHVESKLTIELMRWWGEAKRTHTELHTYTHTRTHTHTHKNTHTHTKKKHIKATLY